MDTSTNPPPRPHRLGTIPAFLTPAAQRLDPPQPDQEALDQTGTPGSPDLAVSDPLSLPEPSSLRPGRSTATRTGTSSAGRPTAGEVAKPIAGILLLVAGAAAVGVRWWLKRKLREPDDDQADAIAVPLARILVRHFADAEWLNPDLLDGVEAGNALRRYVNTGPLLLPDRPETNVPDVNQETS